MSAGLLAGLIWGAVFASAEASILDEAEDALVLFQKRKSVKLVGEGLLPPPTDINGIPDKLLLNYRQRITPGQANLLIRESQKNLNRTLSLHQGMQVIFYDDNDCYQSIARVHSSAFARDFHDEKMEIWKSDVCRLAMLYEHGGYSFDNDVEVVKDVRTAIPANASISTVLALPRANPPNTIFNSFIAAMPQHPAIMDAMDGVWAWYLAKQRLSHTGFDWKDHRMIVSEVLGSSLLKWLDVDKLEIKRQYRTPYKEQKEFAYFFSESEELLDSYRLQRRSGRGGGCNVAVVDGEQAIAWSRFVGSTQWCRKVNQPFSDSNVAFIDAAGREFMDNLIPNKLLFNFKVHLFTPEAEKNYAELQRNVNNIINHHTGMEVIFYDNKDCYRSIKRVHSAELADYFENETTGMFKSDICRLAQLYEHGGYYFDNDMEVMQDMRRSLPPGVSFSSVLALARCNRPNSLFQAFAAVMPRHPLIMDALNGTLKWYAKEEYKDLRGVPTGYKRLMGTEVLGSSVMRWLGVDTLKTGLIQQRASPSVNFFQRDWPGQLEFAYFFDEAEGDLDKYGLRARRGKGGSCNIFVRDNAQPLAWSRFVGSGLWCDHEKPWFGFR
mmetsp:Transcript_140513/g.262053  ORF Transcript_140513/g.262053 Transcript_140513/m.262053 type:complete len:608 (+) Transcript_140513:65-1888(+)